MLRRTAIRCGGNAMIGTSANYWSTQSDMFDPRVVYGDEPWNNPLKATTGFAGIPVEHRWRKKLIALYSRILDDIKMIPEDNAYRMVVEAIYREFLRIVSNVGDTDWRIVERKIGLGQVEQLVYYAMDERELVQAYCEWKLWLIPIETVREIHEEMKADNYFNLVGPPEPYLSDEEINDMKKIDQQRMAEEQKHIQQDLQKLAGKTSRMMLDDQQARVEKRAEYKAAVDEYIRETRLNNAFKISGDGTVQSMVPETLTVNRTRPAGFANTQVSAHHADPNSSSFNSASSYDMDPEKKQAAISDWKESIYWASSPKIPMPGGIPTDSSGALPSRLQQWSAERDGAVSVSATDSPHIAPVSKGTRTGKKIPKWVKPENSLARSSEAPPHKEE
ncbi:putative NADH dehydrogenase 1 alpha subcomplex subunit 5 [Diplonema papillatum]|nr:putative NADH dehydrogenase 1 alpha subcomplex subunit 5 [Diplonema papillatum]